MAFYRAVVLALFCMVLIGCSENKEPEQTRASGKTATEQTVEAIKDYGRKPIDKARTTQNLGEERLKAIDEAASGQ